MNIPAGWLAHPEAPGFMFNPTTRQVLVIPAGPPAAPAGPALAPAPGALPQFVSGHQHDRAPNAYNAGSDVIWMDFPELPRAIGSQVEMILRLIPLRADFGSDHWTLTARHKLPIDLFDYGAGTSKHVYADCFDIMGGPGSCPVCAGIKELSTIATKESAEFVAEAKSAKRIMVQALDMQKIGEHYKQAFDPAGHPIVDASGQPAWKIVPGVFTVKSKLFASLQGYYRQKAPDGQDWGDPCDPKSGWTLRATKSRAGFGQYEVAYSGSPLERLPLLGSAYENVLHNTFDVRAKCVRFRDRVELETAMQKFIAKVRPPTTSYGLPGVPGSGWIPHPGYPGHEYNPLTGQVRAAVPMGPPTMPGMPPAYAAPMATYAPPTAAPAYAPPTAAPPAAPAYVPPAAPPAAPAYALPAAPAYALPAAPAYVPPAAPAYVPPAAPAMPPPPAGMHAALPPPAAPGLVGGAPPPPPAVAYAPPPPPPASAYGPPVGQPQGASGAPGMPASFAAPPALPSMPAMPGLPAAPGLSPEELEKQIAASAAGKPY